MPIEDDVPDNTGQFEQNPPIPQEEAIEDPEHPDDDDAPEENETASREAPAEPKGYPIENWAKVTFPAACRTVTNHDVVLAGFLPKTGVLIGEVLSRAIQKWEIQTWRPDGYTPGYGGTSRRALNFDTLGIPRSEGMTELIEKYADPDTYKHHKEIHESDLGGE